MRYFLPMITCAVLLFAVSCVKEERQECPATLVINVGDMVIPEGMEEGVVDIYVLDRDSNIVFSDMRRWRDSLQVKTSLERKDYHVTAILTDDSVYGYQSGNEIVIPLGLPGFRMYGEAVTARLDKDVITVTPFVTKQYSAVTVRNKNTEEGIVFSDYQIEVTGDYSGYKLADLSARSGDFFYKVTPKEESFTFLMPRQGSCCIMVTFYTNNTLHTKLCALELWRSLEKAGYDYEAKNLADIDVEIDFKKGTAAIHIQDYEEVIMQDLQ